jgi:small GTP-binding protein
LGSEQVSLCITDTAGQEQFRSFTSSYFRDKDGYVVVFDVASTKSFENLSHWVKEIRAWDEAFQICVVGNKIDLEKRVISTREAEEFVGSLGAGATYVECSAKLNINCSKVFEQITRQCNGVLNTSSGSLTSSNPTLKLTSDDNEAQDQQKNFACPCN